MAWAEFFVNRAITADEIAVTVARILVVDPGSLNVIVDDTRDWWPDNDETTGTVVLRRVAGDFVTRIDLIILDLDLVKDKSPLEVITDACSDLECAALSTYGENSVNPYAWIMTNEKREHYRVRVDQDILDRSANMGLRIVKVIDQIEY